MHRRWIMAAGALATAATTYAVAQNVDGLDIQAVLRRGDAQDQDAQALADDVARRSKGLEEEARKVAQDGQRNLEASIGRLGGGAPGPINFDELVRTVGDNQADRGRAPQLIVFASLSMPPESLKKLIADTAKAGGAVVFNGFPGNSMKAFQEGILRVVDRKDDYPNIGIDPRLFRAFDVTAVPTFVVVTSDFDICDGFHCQTEVPPFDRMSGNVTLDYVLDAFAGGRGPGAVISAQALQRLRAKGSI